MDKKTLYISMLRKFITGQKFAPDEIITALAKNDQSTAERLAHTLKSVSGNIGATGLQQLAEKVETAIKEDRPRNELDGLLVALKNLLTYFIMQLEQSLPKEIHKEIVLVDPEKLKLVCSELDALLSDDDAEAADVLDTHAELLNAAFPELYRKIDNSIRIFDFEAALLALRLAIVTFSNHAQSNDFPHE
jgi:HPt (histidine-containing phosphotransfer) domain-containing protein